MNRAGRAAIQAVRFLVVVAVAACALAAPHLATAQSPSDASPRPTVVLVHGAWADASSWGKVIPLLQHDRLTVVAPPNPLRGLTSDAAYLVSYLKTVTGPIVLVGHSYGGAVITNAATGNPNVKALVYIDAFAPAMGENLEQLTFAQPGSCLGGGGEPANVFNFAVDPSQPAGDPDLYLKIPAGPSYDGFGRCFANFVPAREAAVLGAVQRPLALGAFTTPSGAPGWATIPSWALIGREDRAIPPAELTFMAKRANARIEYATAGHLSMLTQPRATASVIERAANAVIDGSR
jgi:pimeloyl-ACP methyl ester carboxylesterase